MPEIHRVARVPKGSTGDDLVWRHLHAGSAAGARMAIAANQKILQIAPSHQRCAPGHEGELAAMERKLERDHRQWAQDEGLYRRAAEPAPEAIDDRILIVWFR